MQKSAWLIAGVACTLCVGAGVLLFGNQNAGISGTNEVADRFITQLALETYRPGGIITSSSMEGGTGENSGFIDLSLKKELPGYSNTFYLFLLTVTNHGNQTATNFTVKDYIPYGWSFDMVLGGTIVNNIATWKIDSLGAGESKQLWAWVKRKNALLVNKAQICDYEEAGERQDYDSNPCNMKRLGSPKEDDESMVTILTGSTGASHLACVNQACVYVAGAGPNTCNYDSNCAITNSGNSTTGVVYTGNTNSGNNNTGVVTGGSTHLACVGYACAPVAGSGPNTCANDLSCAPVSTGRSGLCWMGINVQVYSGYNSGTLNFWGQLNLSVFPQPLYQGYSYNPCKIYNSNNGQQVTTVNISQNGLGATTLSQGSYYVSCSISTPNGQQYQCPYNIWFSIP